MGGQDARRESRRCRVQVSSLRLSASVPSGTGARKPLKTQHRETATWLSLFLRLR